MADKTRKYLDYAGLETFWGLVKNFYSTNTQNKSIVDTAKALPFELKFVNKKTKDVLGQTHFITEGDPTESNYTVELEDGYLGKVDGAKLKGSGADDYLEVPFYVDPASGEVTKKLAFDLSAYALKSDVAKVMDYKGSKTGAELREKTAADTNNGDVYTCSEDDLTGEFKFHKGLEYAAVVKDNTLTWVELGHWIDLSPYKVWTETKDYIDTAVAAEATRATEEEAALAGRLDVIEGTGEGSIKKAVADEAALREKADTDEVNRATEAEAALAGRLDVIEGEGEGSIKKAVADEANDRKAADDAEAANRIADDKVVKTNAYYYTNDAFDTELHVISEHEIKKLFAKHPESDPYTVTSVADLKAAFEVVKSGDTIRIENDIPAFTEKLDLGGKDAEPIDITIDLGGHKLTSGTANRVFNLGSGAVVEIKNGTIESKVPATKDAENYPLIMLRGKGTTGLAGNNPVTLILDGVELTAPTRTYDNVGSVTWLVASNGMDKGVNVVLKGDCKCTGNFYLPAMGTTVIEDGTFTSHNGPIIYCKNGSPLTIQGGTFKVDGGDYPASQGWAHFNNGAYYAPAAIAIEACNYGGSLIDKRNPKVNITGGTFEHAPVYRGGSYGILVIDWSDNVADMSGTCVGYSHAVINGHTSTSWGTAPADGWVTFGTADYPVEER